MTLQETIVSTGIKLGALAAGGYAFVKIGIPYVKNKIDSYSPGPVQPAPLNTNPNVPALPPARATSENRLSRAQVAANVQQASKQGLLSRIRKKVTPPAGGGNNTNSRNTKKKPALSY